MAQDETGLIDVSLAHFGIEFRSSFLALSSLWIRQRHRHRLLAFGQMPAMNSGRLTVRVCESAV
jgi:hypothetical protein